MNFQTVQFWWWIAVASASAAVPHLAKRAWRLLFDYREFTWRSSRAAEAWISWSPRFGFSFDVELGLIPGHKADEDEPNDIGYGPELRLGFGLGWVGCGLSIPNDNHPDNNILMPKHYCSCGAETQSRIAHYCTGCDEVDCTCRLAEPGPPLFL